MENKALVAEDENVIDLDKERTNRLALGYKDPPSGNWLKDLTEGTIFLVRRKNAGADFALGYFMVVDKTEKSVILQEKSSPQSLPVDPIRFTNVFELFEVLQDGEVTRTQIELNEKEEENSNGDSDRTIQPRGLDNSEDVKE